MDRLLQDIRYTLRTLRQRPGLTAVAVLSLALGIGANAAVFSVFNAVALAPPPYPEPHRILAVSSTVAQESGELAESAFWSYPLYDGFSRATSSFESLAAYWSRDFNLGGAATPERIPVELVSAPYFSVLATRPSIGRAFLPEEDEAPGSHPVILLSHGLWQRQFGGDPRVLGASIRLNDTSLEVIGVLPEGFHGLTERAQAWVPLAMAPTLAFRSRLTNPYSSWAQVVGRLRAGRTAAAAGDEMSAAGPAVAQGLPADVLPAGSRLGFAAKPLGEARIDPALATPVVLLLGAVGFVLLIACANVANLLLARGAARRREFAVRLAVGARPGRIVRQVLTEGALLASLGGAAGTLAAMWTLDVLRSARPAALVDLLETRGILLDGRVFAFALGVSALSGILFSLLPALHASRTNVSEALKRGADRVALGRMRLRRPGARSLLVVAQVALALLLLIGAGLMVKSLALLQSTRLGFEPAGVLTAQVSLPRSYDEERSMALFGTWVDQAAAQPGVEAATLAYCLPVAGGCDYTGLTIEGRPPDEPAVVVVNMVGSAFFRTFRIPVLRGRSFAETDRRGAPRVAVIGEALARELFPGEEALGQRIRLGLGWPEGEHAEVVGVAGDVKYGPIDQPLRPAVYVPLTQFSYGSNYVVARTSGRPEAVAGMLRDRLAALDAGLPLFNIAAMGERIRGSLARARFSAWLLGAFSALGLLLALAGVYSVIAHAVSGRTREIGIRVTLGATRGHVVGMIVRDGLLLAGIGILVGLGAALAATRWLASQLYRVSSFDLTTYAALTAATAAIAALACYLPSRRATRIDPVVALRDD